MCIFVKEIENMSNSKKEQMSKNTNSSEVSTKRPIVVRFAPSPTGGLHIGGLRTAIYNYLFAKKNGGKFLIRIEDTDRTRFVESAEQYIQDSLSWVGVKLDESPWNEGKNGPYRQSERDYSSHIAELIAKGGAYYAFDTSEELTAARGDRQDWSYNRQTRLNMKNSFTLPKEEVERLVAEGNFVIRFNTPENKTVVFKDIVRGVVSFNSNQTDDKVLVKSDGIPTYHFANICDDHNMEVSHVIRGEEWLPSTPLHVMLYEAFNWEAPEFAHLPLLLNPDGKGKLSKRKANEYGIPVFPLDWEQTDAEGNKNVCQGFAGKYEPEAIVNFLCLLGWSPGDNREVMGMDELIEAFSLDGIQKAGAKFDIKKADWFNHQYLKKISTDEVLKSAGISDEQKSKYTPEQLDKISELAKERSVFRTDFKAVVDIFFSTPKIDMSKIEPEFKSVFSKFLDGVESITEWKGEHVKHEIHDICTNTEIKMGKVMPSLRMALTGGIPGPDLMTTSEIIGKEETLSRLRTALA